MFPWQHHNVWYLVGLNPISKHNRPLTGGLHRPETHTNTHKHTIIHTQTHTYTNSQGLNLAD